MRTTLRSTQLLTDKQAEINAKVCIADPPVDPGNGKGNPDLIPAHVAIIMGRQAAGGQGEGPSPRCRDGPAWKRSGAPLTGRGDLGIDWLNRLRLSLRKLVDARVPRSVTLMGLLRLVSCARSCRGSTENGFLGARLIGNREWQRARHSCDASTRPNLTMENSRD